MPDAVKHAIDLHAPRAGLRATAIIGSMTGVWLCYFVLTTLRGTIFGAELQFELFWRRAVVCLAGIAITFGLWLLVRALHRLTFGMQLAAGLVIALPAAYLVALTNESMFAPVEGQAVERLGQDQGVDLRIDEAGNLLLSLPPTEDTDIPVAGRTITIVEAPRGVERWKQVAGAAVGPYFLLLAWMGIYYALLAGARAQAAERRAGVFREAARTAQLRSLRYQVNPHFLFNAFNSLSAMVMTGKVERAETMIQNLSNFYRRSLAEDPTIDHTLEEEFALQRDYLDIEAVRFPKRMCTRFDLPYALRHCHVPGMILQPLIENSVKYGVSASRRPVTITIDAREVAGELVLRVIDDGPGTASSSGAQGRTGLGIGLANVRDRLAARFGDRAGLSTGPIDGDGAEKGYETELRMPLRCDG